MVEKVSLENFTVCSIPMRIKKAGEKFWVDSIGDLGMDGFGISVRAIEGKSLENILIHERKSGDYYKLEEVKKAKENSFKVNHGKVMVVIPCRFYSKVRAS